MPKHNRQLESVSWAPPGYKRNYRNLAKDPAAPGVLVDLLALVGYAATAEQISAWPLRARVEAEAYAVFVHVSASDNVARRHPKPTWFPEPWLGPPAGEGLFASPMGTELPPPAWADAAAADDLREELVRLGTVALKRAALPAGYNAVIVVTDADGTWCAVSSTGDEYTHRLLTAALHGSEKRIHRTEPITTDGSDA